MELLAIMYFYCQWILNIQLHLEIQDIFWNLKRGFKHRSSHWHRITIAQCNPSPVGVQDQTFPLLQDRPSTWVPDAMPLPSLGTSLYYTNSFTCLLYQLFPLHSYACSSLFHLHKNIFYYASCTDIYWASVSPCLECRGKTTWESGSQSWNNE